MNLGLPQLPEWLMRAVIWLAVIGVTALGLGLVALGSHVAGHLSWH